MQFDYTQEPGRVLTTKYNVAACAAPLVSVVTPFYCAWRWMEQIYTSLANQTFPWFEWIVVDDGSTPPPQTDFWERLSIHDLRIRILRQENRGAAAARNHGIRESRTDLIFFLDADDLLDARCLECAYLALLRNPDATWAYGDSVGFQGMEYLWNPSFSAREMKKRNLLPYAALIRKAVFSIPGVYPDEGANLWEDYCFWMRLLGLGYCPAHISLPLFWYRRTDTGALARVTRDKRAQRTLRRKIKELSRMLPNGIRAITFNGKRVGEFQKPEVWDFAPVLPFAEQKTRILLLLPHMECGGADKFNLDLLKHMDSSRYEIGIITTVPAENEWHQEFQKYTDDIFELPAFLDMNDWASFIHYYITSRQVDILWNISSYFGYYTLPWLRVEFPELAIIDCVHAEGAYWRAGGYPRVSAAVDSVLDKTFVTNDFTRNVLVEKYGKPREKTQVIYTGVDERDFVPEQIDGQTVREQHGLGDRPTVLYLCRIAPEKRPFLMLEIAKETRKRIPEVCFLVVGGGPQLEMVKAKAKGEGLGDTVVFTDRVEDTRPYYKAADFFLLCSIKEGLSITTMEAMLMGLPVVSADIGSQYELVDDSTGKLVACRQDEAGDFDSRTFPPEEVAEYAAAIAGFARDRAACRTTGKRCREKILDGYTLQTMLDILDKEFSDLCAPQTKQERKTTARALKPFAALAAEFSNIYKEYEATEVGLRGAYRMLSYLKDVLTFHKSPAAVWRELRQNGENPIFRRLFKKLLGR